MLDSVSRALKPLRQLQHILQLEGEMQRRNIKQKQRVPISTVFKHRRQIKNLPTFGVCRVLISDLVRRISPDILTSEIQICRTDFSDQSSGNYQTTSVLDELK